MGVCDIWIRDEDDYYSYVVCYCDYLIVVHQGPECVFDSIQGKVFTIKDKSALEYFLGGDFEWVKESNSNNEILTWGSNNYANCMMDNFKNTFLFELYKQHSAMNTDYKPELYITDNWNDADKDQ